MRKGFQAPCGHGTWGLEKEGAREKQTELIFTPRKLPHYNAQGHLGS